MINETFAARFTDGSDPLGEQLTLAKGFPQEDRPREIVGVVANVADRSLGQPIAPTVYVPRSQASDGLNELGNEIFNSAILIRTSGGIALGNILRRAVAELDPQVPLISTRTISDIASEATSQQRYNMFLMSLFAGVALLLTLVGLYGVLTYQVVQRTQEIGLRSALGATPRQVIGIFLGRAVRSVSVGAAVGLAVSLGLSRLISSLLFGVDPFNLLIYAGVSILLVVVAFPATYIPARRAAQIDPLVALRYE